MKILTERELPGLASLYLAELRGSRDHVVEFVDTIEPRVPKSRKWVIMISTQFGCAVGCRMCDAGLLGYRGNLSADEMLAQVWHVLARNEALDAAGHPKLKVHFARMGEPSLNPAVLDAIERLSDELPGPGLLPSVSTVAPDTPVVEPFFERLRAIKDERFGGGRFQLQFSVHATDEERRSAIVPIRKWSLERIARFGESFVGPDDRKITLNFALGDGGDVEPKAVADIFDRRKFLVKITPVNPTQAALQARLPAAWSTPPASIEERVAGLRSLGFEVIVSPSDPEEIEAATSCGQLWSGSMAERAGTALRNRERQRRSYITVETLPWKAQAWAAELEPFRRRSLRPRPDKTGLLVMDMQQLFLDPQSVAYLPPARAVLGRVRETVEAFRRAGRPVFFTYHAHEDPAADGGLMTLWWRTVCRAGTPWAEISPLLEAGERVFRKVRYNGFTNPDLEPALRRAGVEDLVFAGVATNLCVESTARDAFDRGFRTFVALDATAARAEELHLAALKNLAHGFSTVMTAAQLAEAVV